MKHRLLIINLLLVLACRLTLTVSAQTLPAGSILTSAESNPYTMPPTPETATFMNYRDYSVSRASGISDVTIPIYEIKTAELTFPVNLTYQGGGIRVTDKAGWVGLGWTLSASCVVNHTVLGLPDKDVYSELPTSSEIRERNDATPLNGTVANTNGGLNGVDKMRDRYDYSAGSSGGSFYITGPDTYLQIPYTENRIRRLTNQTGKLAAGFVSVVSWRIGNSVEQGYSYAYDGAGRLVSARYGEGPSLSDNKGRYDEMFSQYDLNGNLLRLQRSGQTGDGVYEVVDDLAFTYDGNCLASVSDAVGTRHANRAYNRFNPRSSAETQYVYDSCGNMVEDKNRSMAVSYNPLSLPDSISFYGNERTIAYGWRGDGTKRFKSVDDRGVLSQTEYFGGVIYRDSEPDMLLTSSGYYSFRDRKYRYFIRDYLGCVRLVRNGDGAVEEVNSYYPSGVLLANPVPDTQPYKYSGKERVGELGLGWYDFGARHYDPVLCCWHSPDALSEGNAGASPYSFCLNNPVNFVDPDGNWVETAWDLFNVGLGVKSFVQNVKAGNYWGAALDAGGVVVDAAAAIVPLVPGGVGALRAGLKAADVAHDAVDAVRSADKAGDVVDAAKVVRKGPKPNNGVAKPHGAPDHDRIIEEKILELKGRGVKEIRKNQVQVDYYGNRIGNNRPDLQWNENGVHYTFEVDRNMRNSNHHRDVITGQDPKAVFEFEIIKTSKCSEGYLWSGK